MLQLFPTQIHLKNLTRGNLQKFNSLLLEDCRQVQRTDIAGQKWSKKNYLGGYTSYASMNQLHLFSEPFGQLKKNLDQHVAEFVQNLELDLPKNSLKLSTLWLNIMPAGVTHSMHIHPLSVISGTYYVQTPANCSVLKLEDPRMQFMMGSPPKKKSAQAEHKNFYSIAPKSGQVVLFESWLRHEVPAHATKSERVSISFNYDWFR